MAAAVTVGVWQRWKCSAVMPAWQSDGLYLGHGGHVMALLQRAALCFVVGHVCRTLSYCLDQRPWRRPRYGRDHSPLSGGSWVCLCAPAFDHKKHNKMRRSRLIAVAMLSCERTTTRNIKGEKNVLLVDGSWRGWSSSAVIWILQPVFFKWIFGVHQKNKDNEWNEKNIAFTALPLSVCCSSSHLPCFNFKPLNLDHFIHP